MSVEILKDLLGQKAGTRIASDADARHLIHIGSARAVAGVARSTRS